MDVGKYNIFKGVFMKKLIITIAIPLIFTGCKTVTSQYHHGDFHHAVYHYFKGDDLTIAEQITVLNTVISDASDLNKPVAPGVHAHLAMLYFETGSKELGRDHFEQEKVLFPESTTYIDFLLTSMQEKS